MDRLKKDGINRVSMLSKEEMDAKHYIVFWDTINLQLSTKLFCLRDKESGRIFIFKFYPNRGFTMYECNVDWEVKSKFVQTGEGVYEDEGIQLPK